MFPDSSVLWYLPPPVAEALQSPEQAGLMAGEHRKTTIIFLHLLGVEELLEAEGAGALAELQEYVSLVARLTEKYGGFLAGSDIYNEGIKLILVFGAPVAREQDAANALRLCLEMRDELPDLGLKLRHRMGVNSGFVFAGDIGTEYRREYTVMGDAVNLAARLMSAADEGAILASRHTLEAAGPGFAVRDIEPIRVKGKRNPIPVAIVERETEVAPAVRTERARELVGRDEELEILRAICLEAERGEARTVAISGEAGIGKSRLTADFLDYLSMRGWEVHRAQCQSHLVGNPYAPWASVIYALLNADAGTSAAVRAAAVEAGVRRLTPGFAEITPLLGAVLGLPFGETAATRALDEEARRRRLFDLVTELLSAAAEGSPLSVVFEDVHWADHSSLQLASHLMGAVTAGRFMLMMTARTLDGVDLAPAGQRLREVPLSELPEGGAVQLVRSVLGLPSLHPRIAAALMARARGNPLFLSEVARSLQQSGEMERLLGLPESRLDEALAELDIPDRVQALIMSRIDSLPAGTRDVLRGASVLGAAFDERTLRAVLEADIASDGLGRRLEELGEHQFVETTGQAAYRFSHALIQEVAYESLLYARRRRLHERAGSYVEVGHWQDLESVYETLVYHYGRAGNKPRALLYSVRAGDKARLVFANEEAIEHYERAASLGEDTGLARVDGVQAVDVSAGATHTKLADVLELTGAHADAIRHYGRALALYGGPGIARVALAPHRPVPARFSERARQRVPHTRKTIGNICRKVGVVHERLSDYENARNWFMSALLVLPRSSPRERTRALIGLAIAWFRASQYEEARLWCQRGLRSAREAGDLLEMAHAQNMLGLIYRERGAVRRALIHQSRALAQYRELNDLNGQAETLNNLALDHYDLGEYPAAAERFEECLAIATQTGDIDLQAIIHNNLGEVYLAQGDVDRAKARFRWTIDVRTRLGHIGIGALAEANLGRALAQEGRTEEALKLLEASRMAFRQIKARTFEGDVDLTLGELALREERPDEVLTVARKVLADARKLNVEPLEGAAHLLLGRSYVALGDWQSGEASIQASLQLARRAGSRHQEGKALAAMASLHAEKFRKLGDTSSRKRAAGLQRQAAFIFHELGADLDAQAMENELRAL